VILQLYASAGFKCESIRRECQAVVPAFSAKSTEGLSPESGHLHAAIVVEIDSS